MLTGPGEPPAQVLSTDVIRAEVFGDAAVQGPWVDIQQRLHQQIQEAVAAGIPVIVDATHARRAWRLAITQALPLPAPVEWIGWWNHPKAPHVLEPGPADSSHPYPVELDLPPWTVAADIDLRSWLCAFGGGIRVERPEVLRQELVQRCREAMEANGEQGPGPPPQLPAPEPAARFFPSGLRRD